MACSNLVVVVDGVVGVVVVNVFERVRQALQSLQLFVSCKKRVEHILYLLRH